MSITSKSAVIKSFLWKLLERCSVQGASFIISIILARLLMPEEYGLISLVLIFINVAGVIVDGGFSTALIQKKEPNNKDYSTAFYFSLFLSLVLYIILYWLSPFIADFYSQKELIPVIRVLSISLLFSATNSIQRAYVSKHMLFEKLFKCGLVSVLISGVIGIFMAYNGFGVWALVFQYILSQLLNTLTMWISVRWRPMSLFSKDSFYALFDFGWKIFASNMLVSLFVNIRSLLIGKFFTPTALAYFDKGKQLPSLVMENINSSIQTVLLPVFSEQQNNPAKVRNMLRRTIKTSCLFIFPLLIGLIACAKPLVLVLLTDKWLSAVPFIQIFSLAFIFMPMQIANMEAIKALGYSNITLKLESYKKILEVLILVISFWGGVIGIAWGVVVYNVICLFINLYPCKKILKYSYKEQFVDIISVLIISIIMGVLVYCVSIIPFFSTSNFLLLLCQVIIGVFIYVVLCFICKLDAFVYIVGFIKTRTLVPNK